MKRLLLIAAFAMSGGCTLYFGGDDEPICYSDDAAGAAEYYETFRNPDTGFCEDYYGGGGGGGGCNDYDYPAADPVPLPDWASCYGYCDGLDETTCLDTAGCRAAYGSDDGAWDCAEPDCNTGAYFLGCWGTAPSGTVTGSCDGLDAYGCSQHDDCTAHYGYDPATGTQRFSYCAPEDGWGGCDATDCGPGYHCEVQCYPCDGTGEMDPSGGVCADECVVGCVPDAWVCEGVECGAGSHCEEVCADGGCWSECVPDYTDPGTCTGEVWCDALPPTCPAGSVPGIGAGCWTGFCIPESECVNGDPGDCTGPVTDDQIPPSCPEGTVPGVRNGSYTGYCIPSWACESTACESITDAETCDAREDCVPAYTGYNCTWNADGSFVCAEWVFDHCDPAVMTF